MTINNRKLLDSINHGTRKKLFAPIGRYLGAYLCRLCLMLIQFDSVALNNSTQDQTTVYSVV